MAGEVKHDIIKELGVLSESAKGWTKELNLISWNGGTSRPLTDAIIDRIVHDSYRIGITSIDAAHDISICEVYGLDKTLRE